jgi:hypothetical protein
MTYYFRYLPNIDYIGRDVSDAQISNFTVTKNLFRRGKIRDDIFENLVFFDRYNIIGDERPDNVAYKMYGNEALDWIVLLSNNILNVYDEWPMSQDSFDRYLIEKYGSYEQVYNTNHYKTKEFQDSSGNVILKSDIKFRGETTATGRLTFPNFSLNYYDYQLKEQIVISNTDIFIPVSNYEYEDEKENKKRNIFLLKQSYVPVILNDVENMMTYKEGGEQYVNPTLKRVDDIRLYEN